MGDLADLNDLERFLRSREGQAALDETRRALTNRTIVHVTFANEVHGIATTLHLSDGTTFVIFQPSLSVTAIRETYPAVLEREYRRDHPNR